jgi:hypothetical protein
MFYNYPSKCSSIIISFGGNETDNQLSNRSEKKSVAYNISLNIKTNLEIFAENLNL